VAAPVAAANGRSYAPGRTLEADLARTKVKLVDGYLDRHPRLLFTTADRESLVGKAAACPALWKLVLSSAARLGDQAPDREEIRGGENYWRIERVQSGALAWLVTGDKTHLDRTVRWMLAYCKEDLWGKDEHKSGLDLQAPWYLYHISIAYDILYDQLSEADRKTIRDALVLHAKPIYDDLRAKNDGFRFEQNHTYIPTVGLIATALTIADETSAAKDWLRLGCAVMQRCRYAMGPDGYYYEGTGYWAYAMHWHVRYAELISRATGGNAMDLPILRENWRFPLYLTVPGAPGVFDVGDIDRWAKGRRDNTSLSNGSMLWGMAAALKSPEAQLVGNLLGTRWPPTDYPASAFLWFDPGLQPAAIDTIKPYHHFTDHGFVSWRSSWNDDPTCVLFRCGPPEGHAAVAKLKEMSDWVPNAGHVHPDIGAFWLYARGMPLAFNTGHTAEKWTRDHNTLLVDGKGQGMDGSYWNDRGFSWDRFDKVRLDRVRLADAYAFASGEMGPAYAQELDPLSLRRTLVATKNWILIVDDMASGRPRRLPGICHSDGEFKADGRGATAKAGKAALHVLPLSSVPVETAMDKTTVVAGTVPGQGTPAQRGYQITYTMSRPAKQAQLITMLLPLAADEKPPTVTPDGGSRSTMKFTLTWADGRTEKVTIDLTPRGDEDPVTWQPQDAAAQP